MSKAVRAFCVLSAGVVLAVGSLQSAYATTIAYEPFNYTAGANLNGQGSAGNGFGGAWSGSNGTIASGSLAYSSFTTAGNSARLVSGERTGRPLDTSVAGPFAAFLDGGGNIGLDGTTLYMGFLQRTSDPSGFYAFELHRDGTADANRVLQIGRENNIYGVRVQNDNARNVSIGTEDTATHFIVAKITFGVGNADSVTVYRDPSALAEPGSGTTVANGGDLSFDQFSFGNFSTVKNVDHDEVRFGATYADVVPEPASLGLLGIASLGLLVRRRGR
jgi:hypothetical protein